jgi:hypothetical protein
MTNHDEEFDALQTLAEMLVATYRRGAHNGSVDWSELDDIHALACSILGRRAVEIIHHYADEDILGV